MSQYLNKAIGEIRSMAKKIQGQIDAARELGLDTSEVSACELLDKEVDKLAAYPREYGSMARIATLWAMARADQLKAADAAPETSE